MGLGNRMAISDRFTAYVGELTKVIGHADREGPLQDYCSGLLTTEGRRSVEPMGANPRAKQSLVRLVQAKEGQ
jgi:SRSO17 transposase